jgi:hypothetical protein
MTFLSRLKEMFSPAPKAAEEQQTFDPERFIYVKLPEDLGPLDRGSKYEDPLEAKLQQHDLGTISGGGSQLGEERPDGSRPIEFCGLDVDVTDRESALTLLRAELPPLGAPRGTQLQYTKSGVRLQDDYDGSNWVLGRPRKELHPGFDV